MSENLRTGNRMEHVPIKNGLPQRTNGGAEARNRETRPAQSQEIDSKLRLPHLPQIPPDEQIDDLRAYRALASAIILQAIGDIDCTTEYATEQNKFQAERNRASAVTFFKSSWFREICNGLGIPHESAKARAFK
jgi:hypothetical protein